MKRKIWANALAFISFHRTWRKNETFLTCPEKSNCNQMYKVYQRATYILVEKGLKCDQMAELLDQYLTLLQHQKFTTIALNCCQIGLKC